MGRWEGEGGGDGEGYGVCEGGVVGVRRWCWWGVVVRWGVGSGKECISVGFGLNWFGLGFVVVRRKCVG